MEDKIIEYLKENCRYNRSSGKFFWKKRGFRRTLYKEVGSKHHSGYKMMFILGRRYSAHRIVWIYENGSFPKDQIDHINGVKSDNRIKNLRDASVRDNNINTKHHRSGRLPGCHFCTYTKKWRAQIKLNGKRIHLGRYNSETDASYAYKNARLEMGL